MASQLEVDISLFTRKRLMVTLRIPKDSVDLTPHVVLEAEDQTGLAVAVFGPDSPAARADAARVMRLWNESLGQDEEACCSA